MTREERDDTELVAQACAGSVEAFGELYDRYSDRAYRVALSVSRDGQRAEDAVHDAFLSIWKGRASYRSQRGTVAAWLLTVVRYRAIDLERHNSYHSARRADEELLDGLPATEDVGQQVATRAEAERLRARTIKGRMRLALQKLRAGIDPAVAPG